MSEAEIYLYGFLGAVMAVCLGLIVISLVVDYLNELTRRRRLRR